MASWFRYDTKEKNIAALHASAAKKGMVPLLEVSTKSEEMLGQQFSAFNLKIETDIEFNPQKSINCQARTCALLISLLKLNLMDHALRSQRDFIDMIYSDSLNKDHSVELRQCELVLE